MKYCVAVKQVYSEKYYVEADSKKEAIKKTEDLIQETEGELQYDYTLEPDEWTVFE